MASVKNPFEFDAAINLPHEAILDFYIEDFNFSRFIQSPRNIVLAGERGSGKTMTLLYNWARVQALKAGREGIPNDYATVGVYIACNNALFKHPEHELCPDEFRAFLFSQHFLVLSLAYSIAESLEGLADLEEGLRSDDCFDEVEATTGFKLDRTRPFLSELKRAIQRENRDAQETFNSPDNDGSYAGALSFSSLVIPVLNAIRTSPQLKNSHFLLMFDDVQDLNLHQKKLLNTWIALRDRTHFSFKLAIASVEPRTFITTTGSSVLEGHDFTLIDLVRPLHSRTSTYAKLAERIVAKRLQAFGIEASPVDFFPEHEGFVREIAECRERVEARFKEANPEADQKQVTDWVYKHARVEYFRRRSPRANRPVYSGFQTLVYLSTGVVRNLLEPCYWMFDKVISESGKQPTEIPPDIQNELIHERSTRLWEQMLRGIDEFVDRCSHQQAMCVCSLFEHLAELFKKRLLSHHSEPSANSFTISAMTPELEAELKPFLETARRAQLLYVRSGVGKERSSRELYYVPNRMLWPSQGLDPHGQHARVSLKAEDILNACKGRPFPYVQGAEDTVQLGMFDE